MAFREIEVAGQVRQRTVNAGSKNEHSAVMLDTPGGESYELRLPGGNPFEPSRDLSNLVGKRIVTRGVASDSTLLVQEWHLAKDARINPGN